ncbi:MAG: DUF6428 family protein [Bacteroidota bacterium]
MNTQELTNWSAFKTELERHPELTLQFQYAEGKWVDASYHITEIKQAPITSVDCGGVKNEWTEIIIQLWEPAGGKEDRAMSVGKALSIVSLVEKSLKLEPEAIVKIEFGNSQFDTRQMYPGQLLISEGNLIVDLNPDYTQCKAINRGGSCGTDGKDEECCATSEAKPVKEMKNLVVTSTCCEPGGGCC